jgi:hypothetical protein
MTESFTPNRLYSKFKQAIENFYFVLKLDEMMRWRYNAKEFWALEPLLPTLVQEFSASPAQKIEYDADSSVK